MAEETFEGWGMLELMGHRQRAGYIKTVEMFGGKLLRIDIPIKNGEAQDHVTEYYGAASIYALRPATEEMVRTECARTYGADPRPVRPLDYREREEPKALPKQQSTFDDVDNDEDD